MKPKIMLHLQLSVAFRKPGFVSQARYLTKYEKKIFLLQTSLHSRTITAVIVNRNDRKESTIHIRRWLTSSQ